MKIPVGDFLRSLGDRLPKWLQTVLQYTKGIVIRKGTIEIGLDERPTLPRGGSDLDRPHRPGT